MPRKLVSTDDLVGSKVWIERPKKKDPDAVKKMGRVRACVFHPEAKRCVGFIVKRPDLALMFHRKDLFVAFNGYDVVDDAIMVRQEPEATDRGACKALGIDWDSCVLWVGLPVMCRDGAELGFVKSVLYDAETGAIDSLEITQGATANTLLGKRVIPASLIKGFRRGMGAKLAMSDDMRDEEDDAAQRGAILVADEARELSAEGGLAEKAGAAAAVAGNAASNAAAAASAKVQDVAAAAKPKMSEAAAAAGDAVNKGAFATGRQLKRASGMFAAFKEEYDKARKE